MLIGCVSFVHECICTNKQTPPQHIPCIEQVPSCTQITICSNHAYQINRARESEITSTPYFLVMLAVARTTARRNQRHATSAACGTQQTDGAVSHKSLSYQIKSKEVTVISFQ
jgi:hypothetical protein